MKKLKTTFLVALITSTLSPLLMAQTLGKADWLAQFQQVFPPLICKESSYFRSCFQITEQECLNVTKNEMNTCLKKFEAEMPATFTQPADGSRVGAMVGTCTGNNLEKVLLSKRINSEKCNDPSLWLQ